VELFMFMLEKILFLLFRTTLSVSKIQISIKSLNVSLYVGTFIIAVYGYSSASFQIVGYGDVPVGQINDGQIVTGTFTATYPFVFYFFDIPQNSLDFSMIAKGPTNSDPDQAIYNQMPGPGVSPIWTNTGISSTSCITQQFPPAGRYYYKIWLGGGSFFFLLEWIFH